MATGQIVLFYVFASITAAYPQYPNRGVYYHPQYPQYTSVYSNPPLPIRRVNPNPLYPFGDRLMTNPQSPNVEVEAFHVKVVELPAIDSVALFDFDAARKSNIPTALEDRDEEPPKQRKVTPKIDDKAEDVSKQPKVPKTLEGRIGDVPKSADEVKPMMEDTKPEETTKAEKTKKRGEKGGSKKREGKKVIKRTTTL